MIRLFFNVTFLLLFSFSTGWGAEKITVDQLNDRLGEINLVVLDVRTGNDWEMSKFKIRGAVRAPADEIDTWSKLYSKESELVLYCA